MSENAPPPGRGVGGGGGASGAGDEGSARGVPYYEQLRRDLRDTLQKKRLLDQNIANLEDTIYKVESAYLEETTAGNIIRGFDNYIKGSIGGLGGGGGGLSGGGAGGGGHGASGSSRRKTVITDADRVFSSSGVSFAAANPDHSNLNAGQNSSTPTTPTSALTHVGGGQLTTNAQKTAGRKKHMTERDDDEADGKVVKRGKITYARE